MVSKKKSLNTLILSSGNTHKIKEIKKGLALNINFLSFKDIHFKRAIHENLYSYKLNALLKATSIYRIYHQNVLADDSGLEIEALCKFPGIYTAKYANLHGIEKAKDKILQLMENQQDRRASFVCYFALILHGRFFFFHAQLKGRIAKEKKGLKGFAFDNIFIPNGKNKTLGQLSIREKNRISHRGQCIEMCKTFFASQTV